MNVTQQYNWRIVFIYFLLATVISLIFKVYEPLWLNFMKLPYGFGLSLIVGFGPMLAAIVTRRIFEKEIGMPKMPLFGSSVWRSIAFAVAPILVFVWFGIKNPDGEDIHLFGLKTGLLWFIYIYGEEYGWRGFLQQLAGGNNLIKSLIIGIIWYLWHLSFIFEQYDLMKELVFLLVLTVGSYIALLVTKRTNSLLTAIGLHFSFSVMTNIPFTANYKYGVLVMVVFWAGLLISWRGKPADKLITQ